MYFRLKLHEISASHLLDICQKSLGSDPLDDCLEGEGSREVRQGMNEGVLEMHLTRLPFNLIFRQKQIEECLENISRKIKKRGNFLNVNSVHKILYLSSEGALFGRGEGI